VLHLDCQGVGFRIEGLLFDFFLRGKEVEKVMGVIGSHDELGKVHGWGLGVGYLAGACDGPKLSTPNPKH